MITTVVDELTHETFGPDLSFSARLSMREHILACCDLTSHQEWYGKWTILPKSILKLLSSTSVINFGFNSEEAVRQIGSILTVFEAKHLPAYRVALQVSCHKTPSITYDTIRNGYYPF